jgi:hypothetical protein
MIVISRLMFSEGLSARMGLDEGCLFDQGFTPLAIFLPALRACDDGV